jgi:hypothetical protein
MRYPITDQGLERSFTTALLLTASAGRAEAAVLEGIRVVDAFELSDAALFRETLAASMEANSQKAPAAELEYASSLLPLDLRPLLRLSRDLRSCFVLRVLVGLSREVCARMLRIGIRQIDELVCDSVQALARGTGQGPGASNGSVMHAF